MQSIFSLFKSFKSDKKNFVTKPNTSIYVANSSIHGRGVFAQKAIKRGALIEECPVIKMRIQEMAVRKYMVLNYYAFMIDDNNKYTGILLGYGSLYNHADNCNANYFYNKGKELMIFEANQPIAPNEEITINYLGPDAAGQTIKDWIDKTTI